MESVLSIIRPSLSYKFLIIFFIHPIHSLQICNHNPLDLQHSPLLNRAQVPGQGTFSYAPAALKVQ